MNAIASTSSSAPIVPVSAVPISIRAATMDDVSFLDALQKQHNKALGFFPRAQMEGYVQNGWVLIAEDVATKQPLGYCASRDRYLKRDELGVVYQLCVVPGLQRKLIGAALIRGVFERSAYGCKLYCCWCAQDLSANHFWESMGFVPISFRAGSTGKRRVHIFWQRRINADDASTPYWYPCQTNGGAIRADRLVFPIPPGVHWKDVQAVAVREADVPQIGAEPHTRAVVAARKRKPESGAKPVNVPLGGFQFQAAQPTAPAPAPAKSKPPRKPPGKVDPKLIAKARELRDRYLEHVNDRMELGASGGKYDVSRTLSAVEGSRQLAAASLTHGPIPLLKAG